MASQAAQAWAPPAAALPFAFLGAASGLVAVWALGYAAALAGAALAARRGSLQEAGGSVGGFTAGLVLAVPGLGLLGDGVGGAVAVGALAVAMALGGRAMVRVFGRSLEGPLETQG